MEAPKCHWSQCRRTMKLINEGDGFWMFACECGCTRAISKPSTRNRSMLEKEQRDIDELVRTRKLIDARKAYSFSSKVN